MREAALEFARMRAAASPSLARRLADGIVTALFGWRTRARAARDLALLREMEPSRLADLGLSRADFADLPGDDPRAATRRLADLAHARRRAEERWTTR